MLKESELLRGMREFVRGKIVGNRVSVIESSATINFFFVVLRVVCRKWGVKRQKANCT